MLKETGNKRIIISPSEPVTLVTLELGEVCFLSVSDGGYSVVISLSATRSSTVNYNVISGSLRDNYKLELEGLNIKISTSEQRGPNIRYIIF